MKKHVFTALFLFCVFSLSTSSLRAAEPDPDLLMQISVIDALLDGHYDGLMTCGKLVTYGDTGLGTFDALDGEMTVLDGVVYAIRSSGEVERVSPEETTPFASVTWFQCDQESVMEDVSFEEFQKRLTGMISSPNHFQAVRVDGTFATMKTRAVPRQSPPYPPLAEVSKSQSVFEFEDVEGTLIGFWCPPFVKGVNVPGWHVHFLTSDRTGGGHVLNFQMVSGRVCIDQTSRLTVWLPETGGFIEADLTRDRTTELHAVEKDKE